MPHEAMARNTSCTDSSATGATGITVESAGKPLLLCPKGLEGAWCGGHMDLRSRGTTFDKIICSMASMPGTLFSLRCLAGITTGPPTPPATGGDPIPRPLSPRQGPQIVFGAFCSFLAFVRPRSGKGGLAFLAHASRLVFRGTKPVGYGL